RAPAAKGRALGAAAPRPVRSPQRTSRGRPCGSAPAAARVCSCRRGGAALREQLSVRAKRREYGVDVLDSVVRVRGDAEVGVALRGDDALAIERGDERTRICRLDAEERAAAFGLARRDDLGIELVETCDQVGV